MANISKIFLFVVLLAACATAYAQEFTSADGSKQIIADFIDYDAKQQVVTLRLENGRKITSPAAAFSEGDRRYFVGRDKREALKTAIAVEVEKTTERDTENTVGGIEYTSKNYSYGFTIKNSSHLKLKDLNLKYWIVIDRDNKGDRKREIIEKEKSIASLGVNEAYTVEGPALSLRQKATSVSCSSCPKVRASVAARASEIGRDRIVGTAVEVTNNKGKVLYLHSDSKYVLSMVTGEPGESVGRKESRVRPSGFLQGLSAPSIELDSR